MEHQMLANITRLYRAKNNLTQSGFAKRLKVARSTISKFENLEHEPTGKLTMQILLLVMPEFKARLELLDVEATDQLDRLNREHNAKIQKKIEALKNKIK